MGHCPKMVKISPDQIIIYYFQIETSFVNLNLLARNPGSAPAAIILFYLHGPAHMEPGCTAQIGAHMGPI